MTIELTFDVIPLLKEEYDEIISQTVASFSINENITIFICGSVRVLSERKLIPYSNLYKYNMYRILS